MVSLATLMYRINKSQLCPHTGACERMQDLKKSPFELKQKKISLPFAAKGMRRFSESAAPFISPSLSMIRSCGSIPWWKIASRPHPPTLGIAPNPFLSYFQHPSSFCAGRSTHTGVGVNHSPLSTFFWSPPKSARAPDSISSFWGGINESDP